MEIYILVIIGAIAGITSVISTIWTLVADYADKHVYCYQREIEMSNEIQRLKHENAKYYALYGSIQDHSKES